MTTHNAEIVLDAVIPLVKVYVNQNIRNYVTTLPTLHLFHNVRRQHGTVSCMITFCGCLNEYFSLICCLVWSERIDLLLYENMMFGLLEKQSFPSCSS